MQDVIHHIEDDRVIVAFAEENTMDLAQLQPDRRTDHVRRCPYGAFAERHHRQLMLPTAKGGGLDEPRNAARTVGILHAPETYWFLERMTFFVADL